MNFFAILASVSAASALSLAFTVHPSKDVVDGVRGIMAMLMLAMMDVMLVYTSSGRAMYTLAFACGTNAFVRGGEGIACVSLYVFTSLMLSFIADRVEWGVLHATALVTCAFFVALSTWYLSDGWVASTRTYARLPTVGEAHAALALLVFAFADALDCEALPLVVASAFVFGVNAGSPRGAVTSLALCLLVAGASLLLLYPSLGGTGDGGPGCKRAYLAGDLAALVAFSACGLHECPSVKDAIVLSLLVFLTATVSCAVAIATATPGTILLASSLFAACLLASLCLLLALHQHSSSSSTPSFKRLQQQQLAMT